MVAAQRSTGADAAGPGRLAASWSRHLENWWPALWAGLALAIGCGAAGQSAGRLLWHDELFTLYGAELGPRELWGALATGFDLQPPLGYLLTRLSVEALGDSLVAVRMPSLVGFVVGSVALGLFVRREAGPVAATAALLVPSITAAYDYAYEGRPYGPLFGAAALALLAWQAAGIERYRRLARPGLAVSLAAAVSLHYYAVLLLVPLAAGEVARSAAARRVDLGVWIALAAGMAPLAAYVPLMTAAAGYGELFWTRASVAQIPFTYRFFLVPLVLPLLLFVLLASAAAASGPEASGQRAIAPSRPALVVVVVLMALPLAGVALGAVVGGYRHRYVLPAILGFAGAVAMVVSPSRRASSVLTAVLVAWVVGRSVAHSAPLWKPPPSLLARHTMLRAALAERGVPVIVTNDALYTQLHHYGSSDLGRRLFIVMPPESPAAGRFQDSSERAMRALARWRPIALIEYGELQSWRRPFFVYGDKHWLLIELRRDGALVEMMGEGFGHSLLRVTPARQDPGR